MTEERCTFGVRKALDHLTLNERAKRERLRHHSTTFRASLDKPPLTSKFYAKHDQELSAEEEAKVGRYMALIEGRRTCMPFEKYPHPMTENQIYGCFYEPEMWQDWIKKPKKVNDTTKLIGEVYK